MPVVYIQWAYTGVRPYGGLRSPHGLVERHRLVLHGRAIAFFHESYGSGVDRVIIIRGCHLSNDYTYITAMARYYCLLDEWANRHFYSFCPLNVNPACSTALRMSLSAAVPVIASVLAAGVASAAVTPSSLPTACSQAALQWAQCMPSTV